MSLEIDFTKTTFINSSTSKQDANLISDDAYIKGIDLFSSEFLISSIVTTPSHTSIDNLKSQELNFKATLKAKEIIRFVISSDYEEGEINPTTIYMEKLYLEDAELFRNSFEKVWQDLYRMSSEHHFCNFINISSDIEYDHLGNRGDSMLLAAFSHKSSILHEAALKVTEAWEQPSHVGYLEKISPFKLLYLEEYKEYVLNYLKNLQ